MRTLEGKLLASAALFALVAGCGTGAKKATDPAPPAPTVQVALVTQGSVDRTVSATGTIAAMPSREVTVSAPISGILQSVDVALGQSVTRGQVIAQLSTAPLLGQIRQAQATLAQNRVQVEQAQAALLQQKAQTETGIAQAAAAVQTARANAGAARAALTGAQASEQNAQENLARQQGLYADGLVAQKDVEAAQLAKQTTAAALDAQQQTVAAAQETVAGQVAALDAAKASRLTDLAKTKDVAIAQQEVQNAKGALATDEAQAALCTLRSPLTGVVTAVGAAAGETADPSTKIAVIADLRVLQLQIAVPSESASRIRTGQPVVFRAENLPGRYTAVIGMIGNQVDTASNTVLAIADVPNSGHRFKDDTPVHVQIVTAHHDHVLLVPRAAVLIDTAGQATCLVVGVDGVAHTRTIATGIEEGSEIEVTAGLASGERVVTQGGYGLADGTRVTIGN